MGTSCDTSRLQGDQLLELRALRETLGNMVQGVLLCDAETRVVVCNHAYLSLYGLSQEIIQAGCSLRKLLYHRKERGSLTGDVESYYQAILKELEKGETTSTLITTPDDRTIHIVNRPLKSGGWVVTHEDISKQKKAESAVAHMAMHDPLTDLPNRSLFYQELEQAIAGSSPSGITAILLIDLDNFKTINDSLGHPVGDALLIVIAKRLQVVAGESAVVSRLGGDEFAIIKTGIISTKALAEQTEKIRKTIAAPCSVMGHSLDVDASIGIAIAPNDGENPEKLIASADLALYVAKDSGRGTYCFYKAEMGTRVKERQALERDLRTAIIEGQFEVFYQPLLNISTNKISCCEALLRWNHPTRGMVGPTEFIPVAEDSGLIVEIGEWVIRNACADAVSWPDNIDLAVNVSPVQFGNVNILQVITQALAHSGLPASRLKVEITEAVILDHSHEAEDILNKIKSLGAKIAMDDFGTGYSSLAYLHQFPLDQIKIDASFVNKLSDTPESTAIIRAVIDIAESFNMTTVAEGVETAEQLATLRKLGCEEIQGYHFSRVKSAADMLDMINNQDTFE